MDDLKIGIIACKAFAATLPSLKPMPLTAFQQGVYKFVVPLVHLIDEPPACQSNIKCQLTGNQSDASSSPLCDFSFTSTSVCRAGTGMSLQMYGMRRVRET